MSDLTLGNVLRAHARQLNVVRLVLALLVLVSHAWPLGGFGPDPHWPGSPDTTLGAVAVGGFFAVSGVLVTMSGTRRSAVGFIAARAMRIYPAYLAVLVVSAAVLAPVVYFATHHSIAGYFTLGSGGPFDYVGSNALLPFNLTYGIHDVFLDTTPYGGITHSSVINGSLWTLPLEVRCYVAALVVVVVGRRVGTVRTAAVSLLACGYLVLWIQITGRSPDMSALFVELLFVFLCGALLGSIADRIRLSPRLIGSAAIVHVGAWLVGGACFRTVGLGALCVLLPALATQLPAGGRLFPTGDLSYGTYVWAFPVQQSLAFAGANRALPGFVVLSIAVTLALAALSWRFIEEPAITLKRLLPRESRAHRYWPRLPAAHPADSG